MKAVRGIGTGSGRSTSQRGRCMLDRLEGTTEPGVQERGIKNLKDIWQRKRFWDASRDPKRLPPLAPPPKCHKEHVCLLFSCMAVDSERKNSRFPPWRQIKGGLLLFRPDFRSRVEKIGMKGESARQQIFFFFFVLYFE